MYPYLYYSPTSKVVSDIDRTTALCLACSSSLPPKTTNDASTTVHVTKCCQRPICPSCISSNPRLARYNPCLFCLGGVGLVGMNSPNSSEGQRFTEMPKSPDVNINGEVRDRDTFILGDDDEEEENEGDDDITSGGSMSPPPPIYASIIDPWKGEDLPSLETSSLTSTSNLEERCADPLEPNNTRPYKYFINRGDTLQGLSLRFGIDSHEICQMNKLSPSAIRRTPHLLHTRAFLMLPSTSKPHPSLKLSSVEVKLREDKVVKERAEKKLQMVTKEADWGVAKAYVALAGHGDEKEKFLVKQKEIGVGGSSACGLESVAIGMYLDDEEWEREERRT